MNTVAILSLLFVSTPFSWTVKPAVDDSIEYMETHSSASSWSCHGLSVSTRFVDLLYVHVGNGRLYGYHFFARYSCGAISLSLENDRWFIFRCHLHISFVLCFLCCFGKALFKIVCVTGSISYPPFFFMILGLFIFYQLSFWFFIRW